MNKYKPRPIKYNTGENICKFKMEDATGATIENWTVMFSDLWKWARAMEQKYGARFKETKEIKEKDKDLDWIR